MTRGYLDSAAKTQNFGGIPKEVSVCCLESEQGDGVANDIAFHNAVQRMAEV